MLKRVLSFAFAFVLCSMLCLCAGARDLDTDADFANGLPKSEENEILYGSPVMDGKLDELYLESYCIYLAPGSEGYPDEPEMLEATKDTEGVVFFLYDNEYLYACAVIRDKTIMSLDKTWCDAQQWPWNNDGAEVFAYLGDRCVRSTHINALGYSAREYCVKGVKYVYSEKDSSQWAISRIGDDLYSIELTYKFENGEKAGSRIGVEFEIDDRWSVEGVDGLARGIFNTHDPDENLHKLSNRMAAGGELVPTEAPTEEQTQAQTESQTEASTENVTENENTAKTYKADTSAVILGGVAAVAAIAAAAVVVLNKKA